MSLINNPFIWLGLLFASFVSFFANYFNFAPASKKMTYLYIVSHCIVVCGMCVFLYSLMGDYSVLDEMGIWKWSLNYSLPVLCFLVGGVTAVLFMDEILVASKNFIYCVVVLLVGILLTGAGGAGILNGAYDNSPVERFESIVIGKYQSRCRRSLSLCYNVGLKAWRSGMSNFWMRVSSDEYDNVEPRRTYYTVLTKAGRFGFEWVVESPRPRVLDVN